MEAVEDALADELLGAAKVRLVSHFVAVERPRGGLGL